MRFWAESAQFGYDFLAAVGVAIDDYGDGGFACAGAGNRGADAFGTACDDYDFVFEL